MALLTPMAATACGASADCEVPNFSSSVQKDVDEGKRQNQAKFGDREWRPLLCLWIKESKWDKTARNPSSGAYGIPQALPGRKMASAGKDWKTNGATQIKWGLGYIGEVYGTPSKAWDWWNRTDPRAHPGGKKHSGHWY
jgi:hypothetical protein